MDGGPPDDEVLYEAAGIRVTRSALTFRDATYAMDAINGVQPSAVIRSALWGGCLIAIAVPIALIALFAASVDAVGWVLPALLAAVLLVAGILMIVLRRPVPVVRILLPRRTVELPVTSFEVRDALVTAIERARGG